jgi:uncharacterized membrane protein YhaH (DUF805 family)
MNEYLTVIKNYTNFSGRARRKEYWMFVLINALIMFVLYLPAILSMGALMESGGYMTEMPIGITISMILIGIYGLFILLPAIAVLIRRLHDTEKSGWWILITLVPFVGGLVLFVFMVLPGTVGENKFGPDPKEGEA